MTTWDNEIACSRMQLALVNWYRCVLGRCELPLCAGVTLRCPTRLIEVVGDNGVVRRRPGNDI